MWWTLWIGCFSDPLEGLVPTAVVEAPEAQPAALDVPTTPPHDGEKVTGEGSGSEGGAASSAGGGGVAEAGAEPKPPPKEYNPISTPQGARTTGGVRWEGVSKRGAGAPLKSKNGSAQEEENFGK